jgi:hypothetical protein
MKRNPLMRRAVNLEVGDGHSQIVVVNARQRDAPQSVRDVAK